MSILKHPLWPALKPFMRIEYYGRDGASEPRWRIEFAPMPPALLTVALSTVVPCICGCGRDINFARVRKLPGQRKSPANLRGVYYACSSRADAGCARGKAARTEYRAVRAAVEAP
jgi:hypothetical protein